MVCGSAVVGTETEILPEVTVNQWVTTYLLSVVWELLVKGRVRLWKIVLIHLLRQQTLTYCKIIPKPETVVITHIVFNLFFYLDFTAHQDYFPHFEPSQSQGGMKTGDPLETPPDQPQAELRLSHMSSERVSNPQQWDDEHFGALNISGLNHSATGAILINFYLASMSKLCQ